MPSGHAALGYTRQAGGHNAGIADLVILGYALCKAEASTYSPLPHGWDGGSYLELLSDALHPDSQLKDQGYQALFTRDWGTLMEQLPHLGVVFQDYLNRACDYVLSKLDYIPILPISAEEKGLKTRFPTCSLTAANLVQQVLRRVMDHVMKNDPRCSQALGGDKDVDLSGIEGPYYSQDASAATDYHPEWLTRGVYEALADYEPRLEKYRKWFPKLFGVKKILTTMNQSDCLSVGLQEWYPKAPLLDDRFVPREWLRNERVNPLGHASVIIKLFDDWIGDINSWPGVLTAGGQMMGDPTSFPPLMLCSIYAGGKTLEVFPYTRKERNSKYLPGLRKEELKGKFIGDDALKPLWKNERRLYYNAQLLRIGSHLSLDKSFYHKYRGILAEEPYNAGYTDSYFSTSNLSAPPGGSKGSVSWSTQPASISQNLAIRKPFRFRRFLWRMSPYYHLWKVAYLQGIPISAPEAYGGIGVPIVPKVSNGHHVQWLSHLSQATVKDLIVGLGLAIRPDKLSAPLEALASSWLDEVLITHQQLLQGGEKLLTDECLSESAELRLSISDAYRQSVSPLRASEFYFRPPIDLDLRSVPSVRRQSRRFIDRIYRSKPLKGKVRGYGKTVDDLSRKTSLYFERGGGFLPSPWEKPKVRFGLEPSREVKMRYKAPWLLGLG